MRSVRSFLLLAAALGLLACSVSDDLTEGERALLFTESDFQAFGRASESALGGKYRRMINRLDQSRELSYVYEKEGVGFFLSNTLTLDSSAGNALMTEGAQKTGLLIGLRANGVTEEALNLRTKYGGRSTFTLLKMEGKPIGNVFTAVAGKKVFVLIFSGIYFDDAGEFHRLIRTRMDAILSYDPAK